MQKFALVLLFALKVSGFTSSRPFSLSRRVHGVVSEMRPPSFGTSKLGRIGKCEKPILMMNYEAMIPGSWTLSGNLEGESLFVILNLQKDKTVNAPVLVEKLWEGGRGTWKINGVDFALEVCHLNHQGITVGESKVTLLVMSAPQPSPSESQIGI